MMDDSQPATEQMPGTIGRYQIQESIGFGAMGAVYKAFDPLIKRTLAIKTIRLDIPRNSPQYKSFIDRFYHEARISGTLNHPSIVTLFDINEENGIPFLAMEYVAGDTIAMILERGERFNPERVVGLISQIASAVDYAHGRGVVHRDIKPSNLLLSEGDLVKVTDFGIAKIADTDMTQSGQLLGTPSYMSPEQAMGEKLDGRSDIFSLGVCAFEMLSGEQPFPGANVTSILYKLVHVDPIEPENLEMNGLVPDKWHQVFGKVLAKNPDDRYQTAAAFVQDLEFCLGSWFGAAMGDETVVMPGTTAATTMMPAVRGEASGPQTPPPAARASAAASPAGDDLAVTLAVKPIALGDLEEGQTVALPAALAAGSAKAAPTPEPADQATVLMRSVPAAGEAQEATIVAPPSMGPQPADDGATVVLSVNGARKVTTPQPRAPQATAVSAKARADGGTAVARGASIVPPAPPRTLGRSAAVEPKPARKTPNSQVPVAARKASGIAPLALWAGVGALLVAAVLVGVFALSKLRGRGDAMATPPAAGGTEVASGSPTPAAAVIEGLVRIATQPSGATVTINGEPRGAAPVEIRLPFGLYDVQVALPGYETQARAVEITASRPVADLDVSLTRPAVEPAFLDIRSTPSAADVLVDGKPAGQTPVQGLEVTPGVRRIEIAKAGFAPQRRNVVARLGKRETVEVVLQAHEAPPPVPVRQTVVERLDPNRIFLSREVDTPPRKLSGDTPDSAALPKLRGGEKLSVTVAFVVTESGEVGEVEVAESQAGEKFNEVVVKTIRKWRFEPGIKAGVKVKVRETRKFTYQSG